MCIRDRHHYVEKVVTGELPFLLTSCCPSWAMLAKKFFPDLIDQISQELTPMVATARSIKKEHPNAKVVFIGPCAAKKLEASRRSVRSDVDFVVTFEELQAMFDAKDIDLSQYEACLLYTSLGIVSRLTDQKGFDLIDYVMDELCQDAVQIVVLGTGEAKYENMFRQFSWKYSNKVSAKDVYKRQQYSHRRDRSR